MSPASEPRIKGSSVLLTVKALRSRRDEALAALLDLTREPVGDPEGVLHLEELSNPTGPRNGLPRKV